MRPSTTPSKCWGGRLGNGDEKSVFSPMTRKRLPDGLDKDSARRVWGGDAASTAASRQILRRNFEIEPGVFIGPRGCDGMYVYEAHFEHAISEFSYPRCTIAGPIMTGDGT